MHTTHHPDLARAAAALDNVDLHHEVLATAGATDGWALAVQAEDDRRAV